MPCNGFSLCSVCRLVFHDSRRFPFDTARSFGAARVMVDDGAARLNRPSRCPVPARASGVCVRTLFYRPSIRNIYPFFGPFATAILSAIFRTRRAAGPRPDGVPMASPVLGIFGSPGRRLDSFDGLSVQIHFFLPIFRLVVFRAGAELLL